MSKQYATTMRLTAARYSASPSNPGILHATNSSCASWQRARRRTQNDSRSLTRSSPRLSPVPTGRRTGRWRRIGTVRTSRSWRSDGRPSGHRDYRGCCDRHKPAVWPDRDADRGRCRACLISVGDAGIELVGSGPRVRNRSLKAGRSSAMTCVRDEPGDASGGVPQDAGAGVSVSVASGVSGSRRSLAREAKSPGECERTGRGRCAVRQR